MAEADDGELLGAVSGYRLPEDPCVLFVWQVAVSERARGMGLARTMLRALIARVAESGVCHVHTTITPDNDASWALFRSLATSLASPLTFRDHFMQEQHFGGAHATEQLIQIGPFSADAPIDVDTERHHNPTSQAGTTSRAEYATNGEAA